MTESLCSSPGTTTTLLIGYTLIQKDFAAKKKINGHLDGEWVGTQDGEMNGHFQGRFHFCLDPFTLQSLGPVGL